MNTDGDDPVVLEGALRSDDHGYEQRTLATYNPEAEAKAEQANTLATVDIKAT
jgi:hypothetical protein